jgi:hypothetical protein
MNLKVSFAAALLGLVAGVGCSSDPAPAKPAGVVTEASQPSSTTTVTFDGQAYCVDKLGALAPKYPKSFAGGDLQAECRKMLDQTAATSAKTIDALLEAAEGYYKVFG